LHETEASHKLRESFIFSECRWNHLIPGLSKTQFIKITPKYAQATANSQRIMAVWKLKKTKTKQKPNMAKLYC